ncbi:MAG TPA: HAMP domain-containing sensor histidine kinase [Armatimonadota bacterium]|jgi:signal transduction histidine kinase
MRFVPKVRNLKVNVRTRLTLAFLLVTTLSWALGFLTLRFLMQQDLQRFNREMEARDAQARIHMGPMGSLSFGPPPDGALGPPPGPNGRDGFPRPPGPPGPRGPQGPGAGPWRPIYQSVWAQSVISVILGLLAGWYVSLRFSRPLAALAEGARALHGRQFSHRIPVTGTDEFADVATTMNEMAEEVGAQIAALENDARRRRQVLADVAHELRSPVATLEAMTSALQDGLADQPDRRAEALSFMRGSTERMRRLVNDLLEVARLDLNEVPLVRSTVDLRELADDAVSTHMQAAEAAGIRLEPVADGEPVMVELDRLRLSQVLDNLLENAISYSGRGAEARVIVTAQPPGFVVEDTGAGIAARHLPFVFDPFYRADVARTPGDNHSGLGLRIARGLMEAHGGTLTLESVEGHGTRATLTFPISTGTRPQEERHSPQGV